MDENFLKEMLPASPESIYVLFHVDKRGKAIPGFIQDGIASAWAMSFWLDYYARSLLRADESSENYASYLKRRNQIKYIPADYDNRLEWTFAGPCVVYMVGCFVEPRTLKYWQDNGAKVFLFASHFDKLRIAKGGKIKESMLESLYAPTDTGKTIIDTNESASTLVWNHFSDNYLYAEHEELLEVPTFLKYLRHDAKDRIGWVQPFCEEVMSAMESQLQVGIQAHSLDTQYRSCFSEKDLQYVFKMHDYWAALDDLGEDMFMFITHALGKIVLGIDNNAVKRNADQAYDQGELFEAIYFEGGKQKKSLVHFSILDARYLNSVKKIATRILEKCHEDNHPAISIVLVATGLREENKKTLFFSSRHFQHESLEMAEFLGGSGNGEEAIATITHFEVSYSDSDCTNTNTIMLINDRAGQNIGTENNFEWGIKAVLPLIRWTPPAPPDETDAEKVKQEEKTDAPN